MEKNLPNSFKWVKNFKRYEGNPIIRPGGEWAADLIFNPAAIVKDDTVMLLCRGVNLAHKRRSINWSVSCLIWARSKDGIHFELDDKPFLYPDENSEYTGGYEDPRIVYIPEEKLYLLTYTGVKWTEDGKLDAPCLLAVSKDLENWEFLGEKFPARAVCIINERIDGKYWGYYGNSNKYITWSEDLINWHSDGEILIRPRRDSNPEYFDSCICEGACPPIVSDEGILFIYNGATSIESTKEYSKKNFGMKSYTDWGMYSTGWVLIDRNDPKKVIARSEEPFLAPYESYECYGMVYFTIFSGGCVEFKGKHFLYYGACDNRIGVAIAE